MCDDRLSPLKRKFNGAPGDTAGVLLSVADTMEAIYLLISISGYKSGGEMVLSTALDYAEYVTKTRYRRRPTEDVSHV